MMDTFNIHEAKTHFSKIIDKVTQGHSVVICKAGKPVARVVRYTAEWTEQPTIRRLGFMADAKWQVPDDFDRMGSGEIEALFGIDR
jgi:prevent-host-death family protein